MGSGASEEVREEMNEGGRDEMTERICGVVLRRTMLACHSLRIKRYSRKEMCEETRALTSTA